MDDENYMERAFSAYYRYGKKMGYVEGQLNIPSMMSHVQQDNKGLYYAVLRNSNNVLAVYRIKNDGYLKRLIRYPKELEED